jgi:tRNA dimethylallyltransferase
VTQPQVLVIVGPTAAGKTALSLALARALGGEIVSVDSRLFYRGMDIGTAKPTPAERAIAPHHLVDICDPDETLSLSEFQHRAYAAIDDILARGRLPILVGGTGQYVMAVVEGWGIPEVAPQPALRRALEALPTGEAARWLLALDPAATERNDVRNVRRVVRALEVILTTGRRMTDLQEKTPPPYDFLILGVGRDRDELYARIDARVEAMMAAGLLDEVQALRAAGYGRRLPAMSAVGYRQLLDYLDGRRALEEAVDQIKYDTHRLARKQGAWFRESDPRIKWLEPGETVESLATIAALVTRWLATGEWFVGSAPEHRHI